MRTRILAALAVALLAAPAWAQVNMGAIQYTPSPHVLPSGQIYTATTATADNLAWWMTATNASGEHFRAYNNGRLDLTTWGTDGGVLLLTIHPTVAANGQRAGHYAYRAYDDAGLPHTIGRLNGYITNVAHATLSSRLDFDFMAAVDGTATYAYPNKTMSLSSSGLVLPTIPISGVTTFTASGILTLNQNGTVLFGNTADAERGRVQYDGSAVTLQSASGFDVRIKSGTIEGVRFKSGQELQLVDAGTKPTCEAATRGSEWYDAGGAGVADTREVCLKNAANAYAWVVVATPAP